MPYEVVKISKDIGAPVTATGEENVSTKGSGTIIVYNTFSSASQRLIKNTRFETPEGLIYRINDSIVVPGQTTAGGKKVPGSIEVVVYADEAGDRYNIGLKDFTIPGFKGDPRFTAMYARSKTAMTGGFVGVMKKVAQADLGTAKSTLDSQLKEALSKEVSAQIPADYVVFPDAMLFAFENLPQSNPQGSTVQVNERGTLTALMFNKNKLAQYVASAVSSEFASSSSSISNLSSLGFAMQNKTSFNPALDSSFTFTLTGPVSFLSQVDTAKFASDIAGKPKSSLPSVLVNYPSIERAEVVLRPFWKRSFPSNPKDITIDVLNTQ